MKVKIGNRVFDANDEMITVKFTAYELKPLLSLYEAGEEIKVCYFSDDHYTFENAEAAVSAAFTVDEEG